MISCILLVFLIGFYRTGEMSTHGKLSKDSKSFFGAGSWVRKYKDWDTNVGLEERWFTSTTLTVFLTDFYHLSQFIWLKLLCVLHHCESSGVAHIRTWSATFEQELHDSHIRVLHRVKQNRATGSIHFFEAGCIPRHAAPSRDWNTETPKPAE